jgi:CubicO group peptidase (beta-lactamase class C family)
VPTIDRDPIEQLVSAHAARHHCPTISWGIVAGGALTDTGSVGSVTENTIFRIASMTKSFSAAATLWLRDQHALRLDDEIGTHVPGLAGVRSPSADAPPVTIRDLLSMTSGLATDDAWADRHLDLTDDEFDSIIETGLLFAQPTGTRYEYSNFGFAILGRVIQRITGERIQDIITDQLLQPLGMASTTWIQPEHEDWAAPQRWLDDRHMAEHEPLGDGLIAPMGGIWTNIIDLARWVTWLAEAFPARNSDDNGPLSRATRREMQTMQRFVGSPEMAGRKSPTGYGYGLRVSEDSRLGTVVSHSGGFPGYGSNMRWITGRGDGVIALSNVTYAPMAELTARILDELHRQDIVGQGDRPLDGALEVAGTKLVALFNEWSDDSADELFADNVALDDSNDRRRLTIAETMTMPISIDRITATTDALATIAVTDAAAQAFSISYSLGPTVPPRIQHYQIKRSVAPERR